MTLPVWPTPSEQGACGGCTGCLETSCELTLVHVDENRCEDDIFGIYLIRPDGTERFIEQIDLVSSPPGCCGSDDEDHECPQTRITVPLTVGNDDLDACCRFRIALRLEGYNCCGTFTRFSIEGPAGEVYSQYFSGDFEQTFDVRDLCNPAP